MPISSTVRQEDYANFLTEANELLQTIEQALFNLKHDRTPAQVHTLMRAAHTLKGAAASIGLDTIKAVSHVLEDVFRALYNPDVIVDAEVEALLFQAYECLRLTLMGEFTGGMVNESEILDRSASILSQLQAKLGDLFEHDPPMPTSTELGFDLVQSMFEGGVEQRLQSLAIALQDTPLAPLTTQLQAEAEVFLGLAESLQLTGFGEIAQATLDALAASPKQAKQIGELALADFRQGQAAVLGGDRTQGGTPSSALKQLAHPFSPTPTPPTPELEPNLSLDALFDAIDSVPLDPLPHPSPPKPTPPTSHLPPPTSHLPPSHLPTPTPSAPPHSLLPSAPSAPSAPSPPPPPPPSPTLTTPTPTPHSPLPTPHSPLPTPHSPLPTPHSPLPTPHSPPSSEPIATPAVRVNLEQLERLDHLAGELLINQNQQTTQDEQFRFAVEELLDYLRKHQRTLSELQSWSDFTLATEGHTPTSTFNPLTTFDALEMDRYSDFHVLAQSALNDLVQLEMVGQTLEHLTRQVRQTRDAQQRLLTSVQDDLTAARMQPLGEVLQRLPRVLQQLATAHHKPVVMTLHGTHVLVDKAIAEKLYTPLLHLVRNAFDHGIETTEHRRANGKPESGQIQIHAYHQGNRTLIEIQDDGQGVDWQRVAAKAVAIGLLSAEAATDVSTSSLADFLFQSGFSTAAQVSDLSGRGVGLDMVRDQIQGLKGTVTVRSLPGQGTTFVLSLPLSLTITRLMVCQSQDKTYALPINAIQQVILPKSDQLTQTNGQLIALRWHIDQVEQMVPIYTLSGLLHYPLTTETQAATAPLPIILLRSPDRLWGLQVDHILSEQELVIRPLGSTIAPPAYVYGCSVLGDSQLALVIDPALMQPSAPSHSLPAQAVLPTPDRVPLAPKPTHILLVEDSLTIRHTLARLLQANGYQVSQAGDGLAAIAHLQQHPDVALIISDIEMPRMNGFEFLSQLRKTPAFKTIPTLLLTSRSGEKYRQVATGLGANAFISKPYADAELLATLNTLLLPTGQPTRTL